MRRAQEKTWELVDEGTLEEGVRTYVHLLAESGDDSPGLSLPPLQAPTITEQSLDEFGVRELSDGELCPQRPVLVNERMLEEILSHTEEAGAEETGGGTLGKMIQLDQPLPGTSTRIVTLLSASLVDSRHDGTVARITFDPAALQEAAQVAQLRAKGETVLTAYHSHGWGRECGKCNQNTTCALPSATHVSLDDYRVLACLFPSKATLMPITGRKLGAQGTRPVLEIHAWRGGGEWSRFRGGPTATDGRTMNGPTIKGGPMKRLAMLAQIIKDAGYGPGGSAGGEDLLLEVDRLLIKAETDPEQVVAQVLAGRMAGDKAKKSTAEVMKSVEALQGILEQLLAGRPLLCRLENVSGSHETEARATVTLGGQLRELAVHPNVDLEALGALMPWHFVCVHPQEMIITGYRDDSALFARAQGDLVEFLGWADESRHLVRVSHLGNEERIVGLAPSLRGVELQAPARLVLQRDDDRWAIEVVPQERRESRFEIPVETITTNLDDLAGLDSVKECLI